jgi:malate dehydrogenase
LVLDSTVAPPAGRVRTDARIPRILRSIAVLGSGELAATLVRRIAEQELARRVVLVDADETRARGKALDIAQSGPVEGFDVQIEAAASLTSAGAYDALVVADPPELADRQPPSFASALGESLAPSMGQRPLVVASAAPSTLIEAAVRKGLGRERVIGSAPVAYAAALTRRLASELDVEPRAVSALVLGLPPERLIVPRESVRVAGAAVDLLSPTALRRAAGALSGRSLGPVALAAAAARVLRALQGTRPSALSVVVHLQGEYGHRGAAVAVPARLAAGRLQGVLEIALDPVDRVAFDDAVQKRAREAYWS